MSNSLVTRRTSCRLCNSSDVVLVLPMKPSPIGDAFIPKSKKSISQPLIPLDLYQCQACGHAQNLDVVNPDVLFRDYIFTTTSSKVLISHFEKYATEVVEKFDMKANSLVVEIGSNDGTLLKYFKSLQMRVLGIDPALAIAEQANLDGITTLPEFFTVDLTKKIVDEYGKAKIVVANNVYAHSDHLAEMTDAIELLLDTDGVFVFEVSYLLDIVDRFLFDTIYHEHVSYHSISSLSRFFKAHGLHFFDVEMVSTKGGSMRGFVQKIDGSRKEAPIIQDMINEEMRRGLNHSKIFNQFEKDILARRQALQEFIAEAFKNKQRVVGYGASTTVTTLMYHLELEDKLEYLVDDNPRKQGLFSPGCHLEVKPSSTLYSDKPDIVIILAWQFANNICNKHHEFVKNGGRFVIPLPNLTIIDQLNQITALTG